MTSTKGTIENFHIVKESYCPSCQDSKAITTILPTHIPMFQHICILAITCPLCAFKDSQILFTGRMPSKGKKFILELKSSQDLDRQIVKSDHAVIYLPQLELEIPSETQQGTISTVEGVLRKVVRDLEAKQKQRVLVGDLENFHRCHGVICALEALIFSRDRQTDFCESQADSFRYPFKFILDDPSGLSMVENPFAPQTDESVKEIYYQRSSEQNITLGLQPIDQQTNRNREIIRHGIKSPESVSTPVPPSSSNNQALQIEVDIVPYDTEESGQTTQKSSQQIGRDEALKFPTQCPSCHAHTKTAMCIIDIPHFQQVIIMSLNCEKCGFKSNEIKPSGAIPKYASKIILTIDCLEDFKREVLKSDSAGVEIPALELELGEGGLEGVYTTVEGLLEKMYDRLVQANPFSVGDACSMQHRDNDGDAFSDPSPNALRYKSFLEKFMMLKSGETTMMPFTIVISDPLANSFVGPVPHVVLSLARQAEKEGTNRCYEHFNDPNVEVRKYERSYEQNEALGLNDMKTEHYQKSHSYADADADAGDERRIIAVEKIIQDGTTEDAAQDMSDRLIQIVGMRGLDHPHTTAKGTTKSDNTKMGMDGGTTN